MKQFVILSHPRSKTNLLVSQLNNHPHLCCHGEVFGFDQSQFSLGQLGIDPKKYSEGQELGLWEKVFTTPESEATQAIGFKLFPFDNQKILDKVLEDKSIFKIVLIRNYFYSFTSRAIAGITGEYVLLDGKKPKQVTISFEEPEFEKYYNRVNEFYCEKVKYLEEHGHKYKIIFSEDLESDETINSLYEFLNLKTLQKKISTNLKVQNSNALKDRLQNFESVTQLYAGTPFAKFLHQDRMPDKAQWLNANKKDWTFEDYQYTKSKEEVPGTINKFVILGRPRSKSTWFISKLSNHPNVLAHGELFEPKSAYLGNQVNWNKLNLNLSESDPIKIRDQDPLAFLQKIYDYRSGEDIKAIGFKIFPGQNSKILNHVVQDEEIRKIIIIRNYLFTFLSMETALQTGLWWQKKGEKSRLEKVTYKHSKFLKYIESSNYFFERNIKLLTRTQQEYMVVFAGDLNSEEKIKEVFTFLDMPGFYGKISTFSQRVNSHQLSERVSNFDEMVEQLTSAQLIDYLQEDQVPYQPEWMKFNIVEKKINWEEKIDQATKGEDLYEIPSREIFPRIEKSLQHLHGPISPDLQSDDIIAVCLFKNGAFYLEENIKYHTNLGIKHFFFMDNGSTDGSVEILKKYDNVTVFRSDLHFKKFERVMREYLAVTFGANRWCLVLDVDEFFYFPLCEYLSLPDFVEYLTENNYTGLVAQMLDVFADRPVLEKDTPETMKLHQYYDVSKVIKHNYKQVTGTKVSNKSIKFFKGGIRNKVFGLQDVYLTKNPFFFCSPLMSYGHIHYVSYVNHADVSAVLKHYKFYGDFESKNALMTNQNYHRENDVYVDVLKKNPKLNLRSDTSKQWEGTQPLLLHSFLQLSGKYLSFVEEKLKEKVSSEKSNAKEDSEQKLSAFYKFTFGLLDSKQAPQNKYWIGKIKELKSELIQKENQIQWLKKQNPVTLKNHLDLLFAHVFKVLKTILRIKN